MNLKRENLTAFLSAIFFLCTICETYAQVLDRNKLAKEYYHENAQWFLDNTPFFECSDKQIEQVYYYRWEMYKAHIRNVGQNQYVITEFINDVSWDRYPYSTINAATMHHIYEGRWLKDNRFIDGYINYMFQQGGNNRSYSESVADAAFARYLVNADSNFIMQQLDSMKYVYDKWSDHFDSSKHLYYVAAMPDATEYTIASIDASNGTGGFDSGEAFRPTINSYMYGNAIAIARIAAMKGDAATTQTYLRRAIELKRNELLKPKEYTRIDKLIELIFLTSKDLKLDDQPEDELEEIIQTKSSQAVESRLTPVNFHDECLIKIQQKLGINFIKQTRVAYSDKEKSAGLICAISKAHKQGKFEKFWFAFHPHQRDFLKEFPKSYVSYGCGSADNTFLIPFLEFEPFVKNMWTTENEERIYWHVVIHKRDNKFLLAQPRNEKQDLLDITKYKI